MAYKILADKCTGCGSCESACPVEAIAKEGEKYLINGETCVSCGVCVGECPVEAIIEE